MNKQDQITILGITGYIGSWLAKTLTDQGYTNIVGTYRQQEKMAYLKKQLPNIKGLQADLLHADKSLYESIAGSKWVFNNTAPFTGKEKSIDDFIATKRLAVDNLFKAISAAGTVKKLVHIGSVGAVGYGMNDSNKEIINEDDWTDIEHMDYPYEKFAIMKVLEEKRVWELAGIINLKVTVLHPTNVIGPSYTKWQHDMIYAYLHGNTYLVDGPMESVDVRDLADFEASIMNDTRTDQKRIIGLGFTTTFKKLITITNSYLNETQAQQLFNGLPRLVPGDLALDLWRPMAYTSFYKDTAPKILHQRILQTKYPDLFQYQYTDAENSIQAALAKMLQDN